MLSTDFEIQNVFCLTAEDAKIEVLQSPATAKELFTNGHLGVDMLYLPPDTSFPLHVHPGHHLLLILEGSGTVTFGGVVHDTVPGDLYLIDAKVEHAVGAGPEGHRLLAFGAPHKAPGSPDRMTVVE